MMKEIELPGSERDICEPLDTVTVCHALNDSDALCQPSRWAGEAIQEAINSTQRAMFNLQGALQFHFTSEPYSDSRSNASTSTFQIRKRVEAEFSYRTDSFELVVSILKKLVPLALLLLVYAAYVHIQQYTSRDTYDNIYISDRLKQAVRSRAHGKCTVVENVAPLRRYERRYLVDTSTWSLGKPELELYRSGLCLFTLHLVLSLCCYTFDYVLYWVLALVKRYGRPGFDPSGGESLELVITGEGIIVELLDIFLKSFHTNHGFGFVGNTQACLPAAKKPSIVNLVVLLGLYVVMLSTILFKAYILRLRNSITGYFYREREISRLVYLYNVIIGQRERLPRILHHTVRANYQHSQSTLGIRSLRCFIGCCQGKPRSGGNCCPSGGKCLVCEEKLDVTCRECETEGCEGVYCPPCFNDLHQICPLCLNISCQPTHASGDVIYDDDITAAAAVGSSQVELEGYDEIGTRLEDDDVTDKINYASA